jgi:hypothetical protein
MGILLLLSVAALACLAGWIAHSVEKWVRNRPSPRQLSKPAPRYQQPTAVPYLMPKPSLAEQAPVIPPPPANVDQPSSPRFEPTGIEARFDGWQGTGADKYPPDWRFRSAEIRRRDGDRCQIAGCPSIGSKHVHHLEAIKNGGNHALSNLITLCEFHHALMPDHLEAIGESLENSRFSIRRSHNRRNQVNPGFHGVKPTVVRRSTAHKQDIQLVVQSFGWSCPKCCHHDFDCDDRQRYGWAQFNSAGKPVSCEWRLICQHCGCAWYFQGGLLEEVGLILGRVFRHPSNPKLTHNEDSWLEDLQFIEAASCPRADCLGHLIWKQNTQDGSYFRGCSEWHKTRCTGKV